jgi:exosortase A-associated hydrolase 1
VTGAIEQPVIFACGDEQLLGIAHIPTAIAADLGVVVVVGGPQYRVGSHRQFTLMARALAQAGYPVLRFDYRGMGDSDGSVQSFDSVDKDIAAAIDVLLRTAPSVKRIVLWGLCDAASACMIYGAKRDARVSGIIVANPWVRTQSGEAGAYLKHYYWQRLFQTSFWRKLFGGSLNIRQSVRDLLSKLKQAHDPGGRSATAVSFIDRMLIGVQQASAPTLLLMSANDLTAKEFDSYCNSHANWSKWRAHSRTQVVAMEATDHTFSTPGAVTRASAVCATWLSQLK